MTNPLMVLLRAVFPAHTPWTVVAFPVEREAYIVEDDCTERWAEARADSLNTGAERGSSSPATLYGAFPADEAARRVAAYTETLRLDREWATTLRFIETGERPPWLTPPA